MLFPSFKDLIRLKNAISGSSSLNAKSSSRIQGDYTSIFHGLGVEFETVRPYVIGDDVRYIDWRVTARIGKPQVKTFRAECDRNVLIIVDANSYMRFGTRGTFKSVQAAKAAALLSWKSLQQQDRVGGLVFGDIAGGMQYFKPAKHDTAVLRMLRVLCQQQVDVHEPVQIAHALQHAAQVITPQSLVFVISDFSCEDMQKLEKAILMLRRKCTLVLLPVHDPADRELPSIGPLILEDGVQKYAFNTDDMQAQQAYTAEWEKYKSNISNISKKIKAPLIWLATYSDPVKSLFVMPEAIRAWKI